MKLLLFAVGALSLLMTGSAAEELTWSELVRRPEFWPAECTIKKAVKLQGRNSVSAGQKLAVTSLSNNAVELDTPDGRSSFDLAPKDTDVLEVAQEAWQKLTPAQRALTYAGLLQRKDLWPYRVKLTQPVDLGPGQQLKKGDALLLAGTEGDQLVLYVENTTIGFTTPPRDTDLLASARLLIENPDALPGRVTEDLKGKLVDAATGKPAALENEEQVRYYVFYRGAAWCGPCRQFSPSLVKFYRAQKPAHPEFEVIYISGDKSLGEMTGYVKKMGFPWRAVVANRHKELQVVNRLFVTTVPQLVVTDRQGTVLIDSANAMPGAALKQLEALLAKSPSTSKKSI